MLRALLMIDLHACYETGAISHEARQYIHIKVDTYHLVLWKSKDSPFTSSL
jgi:hypothetical protein